MPIHRQTQVGHSVIEFIASYDIIAFCTATALVLPTVEFLTFHLRHLMQPNKSLFYSSIDLRLARIYAEKNNLKILSDFGDPTVIEMATDEGLPYVVEYWKRMAAAYSQASRGRVYVLLPGDASTLGTEWYKGTIWDTIKWPILEKNSAVTGVFRIGPRNGVPGTPFLHAEMGVNIKPMWTLPLPRLE
jgi:hypothetical protein